MATRNQGWGYFKDCWTHLVEIPQRVMSVFQLCRSGEENLTLAQHPCEALNLGLHPWEHPNLAQHPWEHLNLAQHLWEPLVPSHNYATTQGAQHINGPGVCAAFLLAMTHFPW